MANGVQAPDPDRMDGYAPEPLEDDTPGLLRMDALDGWQNELTGIGVVGIDKTLGVDPRGVLPVNVRLLSGVECANRWRGTDLGGRMVEQVPDEMLREGWDFQIQPEKKSAGRADAFGAPVAGKPNPFGGTPPSAPPHVPGAPPLPADRAQARPPTPRILPEQDDESQNVIEELLAKQEELDAYGVFAEALQYERAYGGAGILIGVKEVGVAKPKPLRLDAATARIMHCDEIGSNDRRNLSAPIDEEKIQSVNHLTAFRGGWDGELIAWRYYNDPREANYGKPEIYMLRNLGVPVSAPGVPGELGQPAPPSTYASLISFVHESRLLIFPGQAVGRRERVQMRGWGDSIFTRIDEVLSQYGTTWGSLTNLMTDWSQGVLKIKGLAQLIAAQGNKTGGLLANRLLGLNLSKSVAKTLLIDSEEEFSREVAPLTGIADILQQFALRLAAAADMPVTLLMGQAPAGLNATGASDVRFFYDRIRAKQRKRLAPNVRALARLMLLAKDGPTKGVEPDRWAVVMNPLWQPTDSEQADVLLKVAQRDQIEIAAGVVTPEEVAASRHGGSEWSMDTVVDLDGRQEMAALEDRRLSEASAKREEDAKARQRVAQGTPDPPQALTGKVTYGDDAPPR